MSLGKGTWIPDNLKDTAFYVIKKLFNCRVNNLQTMSVDYLQYFGMPVSGHSGYDRETPNELKDTMLSISEMATYFRDGITIEVVKYSDAKIIYEHITDHLNYWKNRLNEQLNTRGAPIEDLLLLDKFAMVVYDKAVHQFTTEIVDSILSRKLSGVMKISKDAIMGSKPLVVSNNSNIESEVVKYPDRVSMADSFANRQAFVVGRHKWK